MEILSNICLFNRASVAELRSFWLAPSAEIKIGIR